MLALGDKSHRALHLRGQVLLLLGRIQEATEAFDRASRRVKTPQVKIASQLMSFAARIRLGKLSAARSNWDEIRNTASQIGREQWYQTAVATFLDVAKEGQLQFALDLIRSSELDEITLPLERALEIVVSGNTETVARLSPELQPVVKDIVARLSGRSNAEPKSPVPVKRHGRRSVARSPSSRGVGSKVSQPDR